MSKPLRSEDIRPQSVQFSHFGVLNDGERSKGAAVTSVVINGMILLIIVLLGLAVKSNPKIAKQLTELTLPPQPPPPPPIKRPPPPPPPKPLPPTPKITPPKTVEVPPELKPIEVPIPKPVVLAPAPPKAVNPPPAPVHVDLSNKAAAIKNNDLHPSPIRMGSETNPLKSLTGPAVSNINLGNAGARTNANNTGNGPHATSVQIGNGCPNCTNMNGNDKGSRQIAGVKLGRPDGTGPMNSKNYGNQPVNVQLQTAQTPPPARTQQVASVVASAPKVLYKPSPVYTAEARSMHLEGNVAVKIKVLASGAVVIEGITHSLGHGLDESAKQAVLGTRFKPAVDASGNPMDWEGVVQVNFQMS